MRDPKRAAIGVIGAGRVGIGLAHVVASHGHRVLLFTSLEDRAAELRSSRHATQIVPELASLHAGVEVTTDAEAIPTACTLLFVTTSRDFFPSVFERVAPALDGAHQVVHAIHTLDGSALRRVSQRLISLSPIRQVGVMAGPAHVADMLAGRPNAVVVGSAYPRVVESVREVFASRSIVVEATSDIEGVEYAAALSQVTTLLAGMCDGLGLGEAAHSILVTRGFAEAMRVGEAFGASPATFSGLAGLGRTVDSVRRVEPNYALGQLVGKTGGGSASESFSDALGPEVAAAVVKAARLRGIPVPLTEAVHAALSGAVPVREAVQRLLEG